MGKTTKTNNKTTTPKAKSVKTVSAKGTAAKGTSATKKSAAKTIPSKVSIKPTTKAAAKSTTKAVTKTVSNTAKKTTSKPAPAKAAAKSTTKAVTKTVKKTASKPAPAKAAVKSTTKNKPAIKPSAKTSAKTNKATSKTATTEPKKPKGHVKIFLVDQKIVYPSQGVGLIKEIVQKKFKDAKIPYYIIYVEVTDMTIMVPVDKAADIGIRPAVSREVALKALETLSEDYDPIPSDWKMRYQMNLDLLKKGSIRDISSIVRSLYHRSKVKELPIQERKLYDSALRLLEDELTISLKKSKEEVENMIFSRLDTENIG